MYNPADIAELMSSRLKVGLYTKTEGCNFFRGLQGCRAEAREHRDK